MSGPFSLSKWEAAFSNWKVFYEGLLVTVKVGVLALLLALVIGVVCGVLSASKNKVLKAIVRVYVELIQNVPLVIQIFVLYNALPYANIKLDVFVIGVLGIGIYHGAYVSEVVRAGIESVPKGQMEAALSQGFSYIQAMRYIILPQSLKIILPPLTNQGVALLKNTSVLAMIAGGDLMYRSDSWSSSTLIYGPAYIITALLYFALCFPLAKLAKKLEDNEAKAKTTIIVDREDEVLEEKAEGVI